MRERNRLLNEIRLGCLISNDASTITKACRWLNMNSNDVEKSAVPKSKTNNKISWNEIRINVKRQEHEKELKCSHWLVHRLNYWVNRRRRHLHAISKLRPIANHHHHHHFYCCCCCCCCTGDSCCWSCSVWLRCRCVGNYFLYKIDIFASARMRSECETHKCQLICYLCCAGCGWVWSVNELDEAQFVIVFWWCVCVLNKFSCWIHLIRNWAFWLGCCFAFDFILCRLRGASTRQRLGECVCVSVNCVFFHLYFIQYLIGTHNAGEKNV